MEINENILSQIYMSQNYDAQPLKSETSKANEQKNVTGRKPEGDKPLENRTIFQIGGTQYDLASKEFRIALYEYAKGRTSLEKELPTIRQRLGLTDKGESQVQENKALDTRSVINEIFARSGNVQAKINDALAGVVKLPKDVQKAICDAIWRQRDNPGIRKFLQSGGSSQDLAGICKLTLDSMKAHGCKSFADRMTMSYLKGFTLSMTSSPITFSTEFEKSFEGDLLIREERTGTENRRSLGLQRLKVITKEAMTKLENVTKELLPEPSKKELTVGEKYLRGKHEDTKWELESECKNLKTMLANASAEVLGELLDKLDKMLDEKVEKCVNDMNRFHQQSKRLDLLAKLELKSDTVFGAVPKDPKEKSSYDQACKKFKADYDRAMTFAEGEMWEYLTELKEEELTDESLKKFWDDHYQNASQQIKNQGVKNENVNKPKNESPKENLNKENLNGNNLSDFLSDGVFKENFIRGEKVGQEDHDLYIKEINETFREKIFPNWPSLKSQLEDLRRETMKALGIDLELESWFMKENPIFDMDSTNFLETVRQMKGDFNGKDVKRVEEMILYRCQIKDTVNYMSSGDGETIRNEIIVGKRPDHDNQRGINKIYVDNVKSYGDEIKKLRENVPEGYEMGAFASTVQNLADKSVKIKELNGIFGNFVKESGARLDEMVDSEVKLLGDGFTEKERKVIASLIRRAVTDPIKDANVKNVWDIKPLAFMRNFIDLCAQMEVKDAGDVKRVVQTIIKAQVDEHFKLKQSNEKRECLIDSGWTGKYGKEASPGKVIKLAIESKRGLRQHGGANCFMVSIVNALLGNVKGQQILKDCFCREDKQYHFKNRKGKEFTFTDADVVEWEKNNKNYAGPIGHMSKLERVIWTAWHKALEDEKTLNKYMSEKKYCPGTQCPAPEVAFLFGLADANNESGKNVTKYGVSLTENKLERWVDAKNHLESGQFVIAHQGTIDGGHYVAVTGVGSEAQGEGKHFTISDSYFDDKSRFDLDSIQLGDGKLEKGNSSIILLTLPNNVT